MYKGFSGLAERTVEDVLRHFGEKPDEARGHYRAFVEKGIAMGRRPDFQSGGMIRNRKDKSAALSGFGKGLIEKNDRRVLCAFAVQLSFF